MRRMENLQRISYRFLHEATNPPSFRFLREAIVSHRNLAHECVVGPRSMQMSKASL
jgi:hypothetical protein